VQAPEVAFTLSYRHDFELAGGAVLTPRLRTTYSSEIWFDPANRGDRPEGFRNLPYAADIDRQDAYFKWDTSLQFKPSDEQYLLEAFVDNLTDEEIKNDQGRWNGRATPNFMWAPGRTFGVRVKVDLK
jgi:iron complex outermembrane receptor protein